MSEKNVCYFHIGMDKCGSSSLHTYFISNAEYLSEKCNLFYLNTYQFDKLFPITDAFEQYVYKHTKEFKNKDIFISNRNVCWNIDSLCRNYNSLNELLLFKYTIKPIIYIPRIDDWLKRIYIENFNHADSKHDDYHSLVYNFYQIVKKFQLLVDTFGKDNVIFRIFYKDMLKNKNIIDDLLSVIFKNEDMMDNLPNTVYRKNPTMSSFSSDMPYKISLNTKSKNNFEKIIGFNKRKDIDDLYDYRYDTRQECLKIIDESFNMKYAFYDSPPPIEIIEDINQYIDGYNTLFKDRPFDLNDEDFKYQKEILCLSNLVFLCIDKINQLNEKFDNINNSKNSGGGE